MFSSSCRKGDKNSVAAATNNLYRYCSTDVSPLLYLRNEVSYNLLYDQTIRFISVYNPKHLSKYLNYFFTTPPLPSLFIPTTTLKRTPYQRVSRTHRLLLDLSSLLQKYNIITSPDTHQFGNQANITILNDQLEVNALIYPKIPFHHII
mmetsp:Transcript_26120/g.34718  ORF Transcript_26120/g.34718 Transcript_26120/m.34718 type:complete len:149 (+) Transcript_26120:44-490(+)